MEAIRKWWWGKCPQKLVIGMWLGVGSQPANHPHQKTNKQKKSKKIKKILKKTQKMEVNESYIVMSPLQQFGVNEPLRIEGG